MGQLAKQMVERPTRTFDANTEKNSKQECKEVITRSQKQEDVEADKVLQDVSKEEEEDTKREEDDKGEKKNDEVLTPKTKSQLAREAKKEIPSASLKEASYPLVPSKKDKECYFKQFLEIFQKLEITIPFGEALQQIPLYTKFLNNLLTKKGKYINSETIMVGGNCSAIIQKLSPKFKDLGSVTIPCSIGNLSVGKTLIDLGASINLMSLSMCKRIGDLKIDPTRMTLQLADHSITRPFGVVEDVLVKVRHFTFLVDFVIMDIEEDEEIPLVLGQPFMLTTKCMVDMGNRNLELSVNDQKVTFNLFEAIKHLRNNKPCFKVKVIEQEVDHVMQHMATHSPLEKALINAVDYLTNEEERDLEACLEDLEQLKEIHA